VASAGVMSGAICAAGSLAPPSRITIFRGAPSGAGAARLRRFVVQLAESASVFFFAALSGAFCPVAGAVSAVAFSAGSSGATGACPAAGKLSPSAIASTQASRITVPKELFPSLTKNARVGAPVATLERDRGQARHSAHQSGIPRKTGEAFPPPRLVFRIECSLTRCCPPQRLR